MEILFLRKTTNGYLINGLIETVTGDENYQSALDWIDSGKEVMPIIPDNILLDDAKVYKVQGIKSTTDLETPVIVNGITYNGGADSAGAIKGAVDLASLLLETVVSIWDINDEVSEFTLPNAMKIVSAIAVDYRINALARQARITAVNAIIIDVNGTYPTYATAIAALDLI